MSFVTWSPPTPITPVAERCPSEYAAYPVERFGGACRREERVADLELGGFRRRARVVNAVAVGVDLEGVELEDASGHSARRGDSAERVDFVVLVDDVEELAVLGELHRARAAVHGVDLVRADLGAFDCDHALEGVRLDVLARDYEEGVAEHDRAA